MRPVGDFPGAPAVFVEAFTLLRRSVTIAAQDGVQQGPVVHDAVQLPLLQRYKWNETKWNGKKFRLDAGDGVMDNRNSSKWIFFFWYMLPVFQVKQRDWWHGVHDPATQWGQVSNPHFWTVAGCLLLLLLLLLANVKGLVASGVSGLASPASSQRLASTDLVTLLWRTIHWTALTWKPLPPHVCEHFDQGVRSHSNFKLSAFPFSRHEKQTMGHKKQNLSRKNKIMAGNWTWKNKYSGPSFISKNRPSRFLLPSPGNWVSIDSRHSTIYSLH